ncbi:hypothetical protein BREVNS_0933 [Brevinematales bacterium NS]|nr:hypothetical protein BREVNS_0933 [Brevinematales bacterium NS]
MVIFTQKLNTPLTIFSLYNFRLFCYPSSFFPRSAPARGKRGSAPFENPVFAPAAVFDNPLFPLILRAGRKNKTPSLFCSRSRTDVLSDLELPRHLLWLGSGRKESIFCYQPAGLLFQKRLFGYGTAAGAKAMTLFQQRTMV